MMKKGQSNLFSFFTKKPSAKNNTPKSVAEAPAAPTSTTASTPAVVDEKKSTPVAKLEPEKVPSVQNKNEFMDKEKENMMVVEHEEKKGTEAATKKEVVENSDDESDVVVSNSKKKKRVAAATHLTHSSALKKSKTSACKSRAKATSSSKDDDDEEAEWDGEDSSSASEGEDASDDDDFSADSDSAEDEDDDDEEDELSHSEDEAPARMKAKKTPGSAVKGKKSSGLAHSTVTPVGSGGSVRSSANLTLPSGEVNGRTLHLPGKDSGRPGQKDKQADMEALYLCDRMLTEAPHASQKQTQYVANDHVVRVLPQGVCGQGCHEHDLLSWLHPSNKKDANKRGMQHADYNPRTLYVPPDFLKKQSPAMGQWWELKSQNLDTILFFKVGKFYELYHMDADVGMAELDLVYMKGDRAHSGFPEVSYGKYAGMLVNKGYRVARVEQTETPDQMKERNRTTVGPKSKVVSRELCSVMTKGTRTYCHLDDLTILEKEEAVGLVAASSKSALMCIKEKAATDVEVGAGAKVEYGVCCVDTIIGTVTLAQFQDDAQRSRLRTMIARFAPSEVLLEHNRAGEETPRHSEETLGSVRLMSPSANIDHLRGDEMPSVEGVTQMLKKGGYFGESDSVEAGDDAWPEVLRAVVAGTADGSSSLVMESIGGALWQLKRSFIDHDIMSMGKVHGYVPPDEPSSGLMPLVASATPTAGTMNTQEHMVLDAVSLANLEILLTSFEQSEKGSLWAFLNRCRTPFGRRLLREWVCKPLYQSAAIQRRASAVRELNTELLDACSKMRGHLKGLVDLERILGRIHANGSRKRAAGGSHPDCRAIMFEAPKYDTKKIKDFAAALGGFERVLKAVQVLTEATKNMTLESALLQSVVDRFPGAAMAELLSFFRSVFDEQRAAKEGKVIPKPGVDDDYDQAKRDIKTELEGFEEHLKEMMQETGIRALKYFHANKDRYQIEVPIDSVNRLSSDWTLKSSKKTARRYYTPHVQDALVRLADAEAREKVANADTLRKLFAKFDGSREVWASGLACVAQLDALLALAEVSCAPGYVWPTVISETEAIDGAPVLDIKGGRHPMLEYSMEARGGEYIPNSVHLGGDKARMLLLSGPNMGGKSTLLRQTCLITIMAQIGCAVPADSCILTPVDRIFTRVGASDRILAGQSTFFVELAETAVILKAATKMSLCILDELGRGTATHDGTAIAHAVVDKLVSNTRCRTLFATHYHSLADDWGLDPRVNLGHMDCMVSGSSTDGEDVTFLYRLADGASPKSYGVNVARLAALPASVVALAVQRSREFEAQLSAGPAGQASVTARAFFDRLCSLLRSDLSEVERAGLAASVWKAYQASIKPVAGV